MKASACSRLRVAERRPDEAKPGGVTVAGFLLVETERPEEVDSHQVAPIAEGGGQHADDLVRQTVDANRAADDVTVTPEAILPVAVADDEHAVIARDLLVGTEASAESGRGAEDGEKIGGDTQGARHFCRLAGFGDAQLGNAVGGDLAVAAHLRLQIEVVGG